MNNLPLDFQNLKDIYEKTFGEVSFEDGSVVTRINGRDPFEFLANFAKNYGSVGRTVHAQVNALLWNYFTIRENSQYNIFNEEDYFIFEFENNPSITVNYSFTTYITIDDIIMNMLYIENLRTNPYIEDT